MPHLIISKLSAFSHEIQKEKKKKELVSNKLSIRTSIYLASLDYTRSVDDDILNQQTRVAIFVGAFDHLLASVVFHLFALEDHRLIHLQTQRLKTTKHLRVQTKKHIFAALRITVATAKAPYGTPQMRSYSSLFFSIYRRIKLAA